MIFFVRLILISFLLFFQLAFAVQTIASKSGLIIDEGYIAVQQHCSTCHSLSLIVQNKASRQGWIDTLHWMQKKQGMALLDEKSEISILNYLTKNYGPNKKSRRMPLVTKKWYRY